MFLKNKKQGAAKGRPKKIFKISGRGKKLFLTAAGIFIFLFSFPLLFRLLPFPQLDEFMAMEYSCRIYDRHGELIQVTSLSGGGRREFTPIKKIPKPLQKEFISQEDQRFYFHHGVDWLAILSAYFQNRRAGKIVRGGSTITMQLAKAINKDNSTTITRKLKDVFYAYKIEAKLSKKKILELYLNTIYFGANSYGIGSAARTYFGCELSELSPGQIQVLSRVPRNPSFYNPVEHKKRFEDLGPDVLKAVQQARYYTYPHKLPHFVNYLTSHYQLPYELYTSLDLEASEMAQGFLREALEEAEGSRITNASLLLLDNKDGSVICWLGNGDFYDNQNNGQIDGVLVTNQPGSSMKPFLYALGIEKGILQPSSVLADVPSQFGNDKLYIPENFNNRYNGPVRMRIALASSLNIPAVDTLNKIGVQSYLEKLYELGFESLKINDNGIKADLGLALGAGEVSLYELVPAFSVFVRDGFYLPVKVSQTRLQEKNQKQILTQEALEGRQVYSKDTARLISSILSDKGARALGFGYSQTFQTDYPSIFKTGTSNQYQDIVALGATKNYTIGVWMGNFSGKTVMGKTGSSLPAWVAKNIFDKLEGGRDPAALAFPEPEGWQKERICSLSGMKAGPNCRAVVTEYVPKDSQIPVCNWHAQINNEVKVIYPPEYQQWFRMQNIEGLIEYSQTPLCFITPKENALFFYSSLNSQLQAIPFEVIGGKEKELKVYYDDKCIYEKLARPFIFSLPVERGNHSCKIICGQESKELSFTVK